MFGHPATGEPLYKLGILRRMRKALAAAQLDDSATAFRREPDPGDQATK